ncbi:MULTISPECIES: hypothetical protein [unclassified Thermoactinomyces]|jgi:transposase|uniref:hypothetical protein n=1 Tax=unclassified Thermoactinomyces TaxID=2634588 RepID=UPI0018DBB389|nr:MULTISPECIES: hypothetical protein [unclassified Thermoactinomyces]MBH8598606.1 hypothetical protein [Thermoactinomyces sp. CICC 10523]MBH8605139.1 hypothetical protein [Thermoactinomyces sp. CICC 10522]
MARPTKLTPDIQKKIVSIIRLGHYIETAAAYAGISKQTIYNWMRQGAREEKGKYRNFHDAVTKALAEAEIRELAYIDQAAKKGSWQAAAWILSRRFPNRWGKETALDSLTQQGQPQRIILDFGKRKEEKE